jgi:hypothetical protein
MLYVTICSPCGRKLQDAIRPIPNGQKPRLMSHFFKQFDHWFLSS